MSHVAWGQSFPDWAAWEVIPKEGSVYDISAGTPDRRSAKLDISGDNNYYSHSL